MHSSDSAAPQPGTEELPVEVVSDEEMAFIDAALAAATAGACPLLSSAARRAAAPLSCAAYSAAGGDIEDSPLPRRSLLARFRDRRALAVTDITATEWCEKQMEFVLEHGKPERTEAMKAGSDRHAQLEQEVIERVDIAIRSAEELWAVKFMNFIVGTNQLMFEGITREIPVIGVVEGSWMIGVIDEIRMPMDGISFQPILVDTKTRVRPTIPSEAHKRNGRLQLMCYKYLWDNLISEKFPAENFFSYFDLDPSYLLSDDVRQYISSLGFSAKEWCEKQMEFVLEHGKPERTEAMKAGSNRHAQVEDEVVRTVDVTIRSAEELWSLRCMDFVVGANQLMLEGITREIPVLQLMCYKYLWDSLIAEKFPAENFFSYFDLDPNYLLSEDVKRYINSLGFNAKTFEDVLKYFKVTCHTLWWFQSREQLLLRYEVQADDSLLEEYQFTYDARWLKDRIQEASSFWQRSREPKFVTEEERWKCSICKFAPDCPMVSSTSKC